MYIKQNRLMSILGHFPVLFSSLMLGFFLLTWCSFLLGCVEASLERMSNLKAQPSNRNKTCTSGWWLFCGAYSSVHCSTGWGDSLRLYSFSTLTDIHSGFLYRGLYGWGLIQGPSIHQALPGFFLGLFLPLLSTLKEGSWAPVVLI